MAVIIGLQKMSMAHADGEHHVFPSADPQFLPDHMLDHPHVQGAIASGWITVLPALTEDPGEANPQPEVEQTEKKRRSRKG